MYIAACCTRLAHSACHSCLARQSDIWERERRTNCRWPLFLLFSPGARYRCCYGFYADARARLSHPILTLQLYDEQKGILDLQIVYYDASSSVSNFLGLGLTGSKLQGHQVHSITIQSRDPKTLFSSNSIMVKILL